MEDKNNRQNIEKIFEFLHAVGNLKSTFRWSETKEMPKDSSADHSWRLALMAFIIADELKLNIDKFRAMKIALVHDIAESITGDVDYRKIADGRVSKEEKTMQEIIAINKLKNMLPEEIGKEFFLLWEEYEKVETQEAKFIKALDKIETLTHLMEVGHIYFHKRADIIPYYGKKQIEDFPELKEVMGFVREKIKEDFDKGGIKWEEEEKNESHS